MVLSFFIAGLLYLLRFERVDNLGAYRIPSETGLLIPSGFDSYQKAARELDIAASLPQLIHRQWLSSYGSLKHGKSFAATRSIPAL
jgi:hypothetical protein